MTPAYLLPVPSVPHRFCIGCLALGSAVVLVAVQACEPPPAPLAPPRPAPSSSAAVPVTHPEVLDGPWARFRSLRFDLLIPFADGRGWQIRDHGRQWLWAEHPASSSWLRARTWREAELMNHDRCRAAALTTLVSMPRFDGVQILEQRSLPNVPARDFDTQVTTGIIPQAGTPRLDGFAMAFGASLKRCFGIVYVTSATGPQASTLVGERLGVAVRIIEGTEFQSELEPGRVPTDVH